ncbi:conjugative transfer region lipoprotein (TIGR03751 family) [Pseudomonas sp. JUb42]|uniref:TIGR03751 family conjugal transfer lipoprotein n=1 Tax=Pseudomonas sp. JUb42 TaxID=2940611 RepID=UPI0021689FBB|nr:TIGR03751 family conjugal transfer lipoprotein [Pseudomonas sp. JUb42]MCS3473014.1 conjugative transfer region lipoprotein (TIGR03751 family) [Pseudomonas sp. JUb42]
MPLPIWTDSTSLFRQPACLCALLAIALLGGCSTDKEQMLPHGKNTMMDVWDGGTTGSGTSSSNRQMLDARAQLRRPLDAGQGGLQENAAYTRTSQNEIYSQFKRLPNPDLVMYVFPHLAGSDPAPVPGYTTVFPLYQRVQYAMPGERVEDY